MKKIILTILVIFLIFPSSAIAVEDDALILENLGLSNRVASYSFEIDNQIDTDTYDGGAQLIKVGNNIQAYFGEWYKGHGESKGKIVRQERSAEYGTWSIRSTVYEHPVYDIGGIRGGLIDGNIYLFFAHYDLATATWVDQGYIKSLDNTGMYWSEFVSLPTDGEVYFEPLNGGICETADSILIPWFGFEGQNQGDVWTVRTYKTIDRGETWELGSIIYSGNTKYCEVALAYIGDGKVMAHMRNNDGGFIGQAVSANNGETWSVVTETNLGAPTGVKVPFLFYDEGVLIEIFHDRGVGQTLMSVADAQVVFSNPTAWGEPYIVNSGYTFSGYAQMVKIESGYFVTFSRNTSDTDADIYGGIVSYAEGMEELTSSIYDFGTDDATVLIEYVTTPHTEGQVLAMKAFGSSSTKGSPGFSIAVDADGKLSVYLGDGGEGTGQSLARTPTGGFNEGEHYLAIVFKRGEELLLYDNNNLTEIHNLVGNVAMETENIATPYPYLVGNNYNQGGIRNLPFMGESIRVWHFKRALNYYEIQLSKIAIDEGYM